MEAPPLKSIVSVNTFADGRAEIIVSGASGTFMLEVHQDGPTIAIQDPVRAKRLGVAHKYKACVSLYANGHLRGWFVEKKDDSGEHDTLVFFPVQKTRAKKGRKKAKA